MTWPSATSAAIKSRLAACNGICDAVRVRSKCCSGFIMSPLMAHLTWYLSMPPNWFVLALYFIVYGTDSFDGCASSYTQVRNSVPCQSSSASCVLAHSLQSDLIIAFVKLRGGFVLGLALALHFVVHLLFLSCLSSFAVHVWCTVCVLWQTPFRCLLHPSAETSYRLSCAIAFRVRTRRTHFYRPCSLQSIWVCE